MTVFFSAHHPAYQISPILEMVGCQIWKSQAQLVSSWNDAGACASKVCSGVLENWQLYSSPGAVYAPRPPALRAGSSAVHWRHLGLAMPRTYGESKGITASHKIDATSPKQHLGVIYATTLLGDIAPCASIGICNAKANRFLLPCVRFGNMDFHLRKIRLISFIMCCVFSGIFQENY